jgi:hypothetical protein
MIIESDFAVHWKTQALCHLTGNTEALAYVVRFWLYCQNIKKYILKAIPHSRLAHACGWKEDPERFLEIMIEAGFIDREEEDGVEVLIAHGFQEKNARYVAGWDSGPKGGRPRKEKTKAEPIGIATETQRKRNGNATASKTLFSVSTKTQRKRNGNASGNATVTGLGLGIGDRGRGVGNTIPPVSPKGDATSAAQTALPITIPETGPQTGPRDGPKPENQQAVVAYFANRGGPESEAVEFFDHYEANGWRQGGRSPLRSWQAASRKWIRKWERDGGGVPLEKIGRGGGGPRRAAPPPPPFDPSLPDAHTGGLPILNL